MTKLIWDSVGERFFETGVDQGVLYVTTTVAYDTAIPWNGLTSVTESPSGAEATPLYADNRKYLNLVSAEMFGATIEAFSYPEEFGLCDGTASPKTGVTVGQQARAQFGLSYRTKLGNDVDGDDHGYKIHVVYGCLAKPTEKGYATVNDSPEAAAFSWELSTTPVAVTDLRPTSLLVFDSTKLAPADLLAIEDALYGDATTGTGSLPLPDALLALIAGA